MLDRSVQGSCAELALVASYTNTCTSSLQYGAGQVSISLSLSLYVYIYICVHTQIHTEILVTAKLLPIAVSICLYFHVFAVVHLQMLHLYA